MTDIELATILLRIGVGVVMVAFGIYQILRPGPWLIYIPKLVRFIMPLEATTIIRIHSLGNLSLGMLLLAGLWLPVTLWLVLAWWTFILPLCTRADLTVGLRDFGFIMMIAALILLQ